MPITQDRFKRVLNLAQSLIRKSQQQTKECKGAMLLAQSGQKTGYQIWNLWNSCIEDTQPTLEEMYMLGQEVRQMEINFKSNEERRNRRHKMIALQEQQQAEGRINAEYERPAGAMVPKG